MKDRSTKLANPVQFLQQLAATQYDRAEEHLQAAAANVSQLLLHLFQQLHRGQQKLPTGSHAAALLCSISNSHERKRVRKTHRISSVAHAQQTRSIANLAQASPLSVRGEAGADNERILISEVLVFKLHILAWSRGCKT